MSWYEDKQEHTDEPAEEEHTLPMDDQGPSYSSSYNESTPGEITENRRRSLEEHRAAEDQDPGASEPTTSS